MKTTKSLTLTSHQQRLLMEHDGMFTFSRGAAHHYFKEIGARRICTPPGRAGCYGDTTVFTDSLSEEHRLILANDELKNVHRVQPMGPKVGRVSPLKEYMHRDTAQ